MPSTERIKSKISTIGGPLVVCTSLLILPRGGAALRSEQVPQAPIVAPPPVISVHSELVVLHVSVMDTKSNPTSGLAKEQFTVYEDGREQTISFFSHEDHPVTVGLVIDNSGSMQARREEVIAAGLAFAQSSHPDDEMFTVNFNEHVAPGLPAPLTFTSDLDVLRGALSRIRARGKTALHDAIAFALGCVHRGSEQKKVLIVVSDGGDNASSLTFEQVLAAAKRSDAVIYTIGLFDENDTDRNPRVLKQLAAATGGRAYLPDRASEVTSILEDIARDIRHGYTMGYEPSNPARDGRFRSIHVVVRAPGRGKLSVRARSGYLAPSDSHEARCGGDER